MSEGTVKRLISFKTLIVLIAILVLLAGVVTVSTKGLIGKASDTGDIVLSEVVLRQDAGQLLLDARADFQLPSTVRSGLDNGVPLNFVMTLRLFQQRRFWFDKTLAQHQQRYSINYYELTRHYRVQSLNTDTSRNYRSLSSALDGLGQINALLVTLDNALGDTLDSASLLASLNFRLDTRKLPLPLQPLMASSWRLASKEVVWPVN